MKDNLIIDTDSYKAGHFLQWPPGTTKAVAYLEARAGSMYDYTLFGGLQILLMRDLAGAVVTEADVDEARLFFEQHGEPFPRDGWMKIVDKCGGRLPVRIRAVPEGTVVPINNVLMTVESLDPELYWLPGWLETKLMRLWYPITVATRSFACKKVIKSFLDKTADNTDAEINFKLHDFGGRGVSSRESAGYGGCAHLFNFMGSDTCEGVHYANTYYNNHKMSGYSIPAMEHSTVISWGPEHERDAFENMVRTSKGHNLIACVSDSYDIYNAVANIWGDPNMVEFLKLHKKTVVIRPDSGDPQVVNFNILRILEEKVGMTLNTKGYKVLPDCYRLIQGDGNNTEKDIADVLGYLERAGYSASNIAFGMGGGLLQKLDRDTQRFAFKTSQLVVDEERRDVCKTPATDPSKASKKGYLDLVKMDGQYYTVKVLENKPHNESQLVTVFENGKIMKEYSLEEVRKTAASSL